MIPCVLHTLRCMLCIECRSNLEVQEGEYIGYDVLHIRHYEESSR